ncbi:MAG: hypothetical protein Q4D21_09910 [Phascolarctobacterium sp.]|nr:hypothetical protein [Phascolarctobacterium sp.]
MAGSGVKASNLILCERLEIAQFIQIYFKHLQEENVKLPDLQIFNYNGLERLTSFLEKLEASENFSSVRKILILADVGAKLNAKEIAIICAEHQLNEFAHIDATYYLLPGLRTTKHWEFGYLEDALLKALCIESSEACNHHNLRSMAAEYIYSVASNRGKEAKFTNHSLHVLAAYLAATEKYVGMRIIDAAYNGAFDFNHPVFDPLRQRIESFLKEDS